MALCLCTFKKHYNEAWSEGHDEKITKRSSYYHELAHYKYSGGNISNNKATEHKHYFLENQEHKNERSDQNQQTNPGGNHRVVVS